MVFLCLKLQSQNVGVVRSLPRNTPSSERSSCHIGAKNMLVTFKIMTEGVRPHFVKLFPRGMTAGVGKNAANGF
jgi:hypothetical protein